MRPLLSPEHVSLVQVVPVVPRRSIILVECKNINNYYDSTTAILVLYSDSVVYMSMYISSVRVPVLDGLEWYVFSMSQCMGSHKWRGSVFVLAVHIALLNGAGGAFCPT